MRIRVMDKKTVHAFIRWTGLGGVVGPVLFVVTFTAAGLLRPGYSPVRQAVSNLGVGPIPWLLNVPLVLLGFLLVLMAIGFSQAMRPLMNRSLRRACGILLAGPGLGYEMAGIFPETNLFHWILGRPSLVVGSVVGFLVVGLQLRRDLRWHGYGVHSLVSSATVLVLTAFMFLAFSPASRLGALQLAGLAERVMFVAPLAWYVVIGWRLFRTP